MSLLIFISQVTFLEIMNAWTFTTNDRNRKKVLKWWRMKDSLELISKIPAGKR